MKKAKKNSIFEELDRAILEEEMAIPIYTGHLATTIVRSGLAPNERQKIAKGLRLLARESLGHIRVLKTVKQIMRKSQK